MTVRKSAQAAAIAVKIVPAAGPPLTLDDFRDLPPIPWFKTPPLYLWMVENKAHLREDVPEEQEPRDAHGLPERPAPGADALLAHLVGAKDLAEPSRPPPPRASSPSPSSSSSSDALSSADSGSESDHDGPSRSSSSSSSSAPSSPRSKRPRHESPPTTTTPSPDSHKTPRVPDAAVDRSQLERRLQGMRKNVPPGVTAIPADLSGVPTSRLREIYVNNQRGVRVESLVRWYAAALVAGFMAMDFASENLTGINMDHYVDLQVANMEHYRHHLYRIAESQVKAMGKGDGGGAPAAERNPYVAIAYIFAVTTVGYLAVRLVLRAKSARLLQYVMPLLTATSGGGPLGSLLGGSSAAPSASAAPFSAMSSVLETAQVLMRTNQAQAAQAPQRRMATPPAGPF